MAIDDTVLQVHLVIFDHFWVRKKGMEKIWIRIISLTDVWIMGMKAVLVQGMGRGLTVSAVAI